MRTQKTHRGCVFSPNGRVLLCQPLFEWDKSKTVLAEQSQKNKSPVCTELLKKYFSTYLFVNCRGVKKTVDNCFQPRRRECTDRRPLFEWDKSKTILAEQSRKNKSPVCTELLKKTFFDLSLRELRCTTSSLESVLLSLLHTRVTSKKTSLLKKGLVGLISEEKCTSNTVTDRTCLT